MARRQRVFFANVSMHKKAQKYAVADGRMWRDFFVLLSGFYSYFVHCTLQIKF